MALFIYAVSLLLNYLVNDQTNYAFLIFIVIKIEHSCCAIVPGQTFIVFEESRVKHAQSGHPQLQAKPTSNE